jgi:hypothetical protein
MEAIAELFEKNVSINDSLRVTKILETVFEHQEIHKVRFWLFRLKLRDWWRTLG